MVLVLKKLKKVIKGWRRYSSSSISLASCSSLSWAAPSSYSSLRLKIPATTNLTGGYIRNIRRKSSSASFVSSSSYLFSSSAAFSTSASFSPSQEYTQIKWRKEAHNNPIEYWRKVAQGIEWHKYPETIFKEKDEHTQVGYSWYSDGELNLTITALDRNARERPKQIAIIHDSAATKRITKITYEELLERVEKCAGAMAERCDIKKGDRVLIYMPMVLEAIVAMYACARLGAVHSVVFGGFASAELSKRIEDCAPKLIITSSAGKEVHRIVEYMPLLHNALQMSSPHSLPKQVWVLQRPDLCRVDLNKFNAQTYGVSSPPHKIIFEDFEHLLSSKSNPKYGKPVIVNSLHPLYILYTSGTTGKPKGIVRDTGGHAAALKWTMQNFYGCNPGDVMFAASDIGWVVGHSYIVYAPLLHGCTSVMYEGKPVGTPDPGAFWRIVEQHDVKSLFAAPTAFRAIKKEDPEGKHVSRYDIKTLKYLFLAGERCDPNTLHYAEKILPSHVTVSDHWWQTETGYPISGRMFGEDVKAPLPQKIGAAGQALPGMNLLVVPGMEDEDSTSTHNIKPVKANETGEIVLKLPLPPGTLNGVYNNPERTKAAYLKRYPGYYCTGDSGHHDEHGYLYVMSRVDDVIKVAGHRLSTASMEQVVAEHPAIAECAVIGVNDEKMKGQIPVGIAVRKSGAENISPEQIEREINTMIREKIGAFACYKQTIIVSKLPKTRSGKILRRSLREIYDTGNITSIPATIDDVSALDEFKQVVQRIRKNQAPPS